jgi:hypothetical protein
MNLEDMNEGVRMLVKRIESDPQEFEDGSLTKWGRVLGGFPERYRDILTKDEIEVIEAKLKEAQRTNFTSRVMRVLTGSEDETDKMYALAGSRIGHSLGSSGGYLTTANSNGTSGSMWQGSAITSSNTAFNSVQPKGPMP